MIFKVSYVQFFEKLDRIPVLMFDFEQCDSYLCLLFLFCAFGLIESAWLTYSVCLSCELLEFLDCVLYIVHGMGLCLLYCSR